MLQCIPFHLQLCCSQLSIFIFLHRHLPTRPPVPVGLWCCPSMHFVVRSCSDCIGCIPFWLHVFSDASAFTSSRTSYRLLGLGYVVHHSVGKHVRSLLALGYDSLEYFIFYIPLDTLDLVTYFDQQSIFDSISRKLESTRIRTSGQTDYEQISGLEFTRELCFRTRNWTTLQF